MRTRRAFTLVELLVVIAIIALLASILAPSLRRAQYLAAEAECRSNLHQVSQGVSMYVATQQLAMPWLFSNGSADYAHESGHGKQPGCPSRALTLDPNDETKGHKILDDGRAFFCPLAPINYEDNYERTPPSNNWVTFWGSYAWHWRKCLAADDPYFPDRHHSQIKWSNDKASKDLLMIDTQRQTFYGVGYPVTPSEHYNILMRDGSAELLTRDLDYRQWWIWGDERRPY